MSGGPALLHAVFGSPADAVAALGRLADSGVAADEIEVRSSIPLHGVTPVGGTLRTRVPLMAIVGGLLGGTANYLLASLTAQAYPLPTGGMPIVALPPAGVIAFEGIAIGAILFTVATVLAECRLPGIGRSGGPLDAHLAAGRVVVIAPADSGSPRWAEAALVTAWETVST